MRWKNVLLANAFFRAQPPRAGSVKPLIRRGVERQLPRGLRRRHALQPALRPVGPARLPGARRRPLPALRDGRASIVTDRIETFTENGLMLESGDELEADVIVTATGPQPAAARRHARSASTAREVELPRRVTYKGMMLGRRAELRLCARLHERLLDAQGATSSPSTSAGCINHMDEHGYSQCTPARARRLAADRAVHRPAVRLRAALDRRACRSRAARPVAPAPELHARPAGAALRRAQDEAMEFTHADARVRRRAAAAA